MKNKLTTLLTVTLLASSATFATDLHEDLKSNSPVTTHRVAEAPTEFSKSRAQLIGEKAKQIVEEKVPYGKVITVVTGSIARNGYEKETLTEVLVSPFIGNQTAQSSKSLAPSNSETITVEELDEELKDFMPITATEEVTEETAEAPVQPASSFFRNLGKGLYATAGGAFTTETGARIVGQGVAKFVERVVPYGNHIVKATAMIAAKIDPAAKSLTEVAIKRMNGIKSTSAPASTEEGSTGAIQTSVSEASEIVTVEEQNGQAN